VDIHTENIEVGLAQARANGEVHHRSKVSRLLTVPQYADTLETEEEDDNGINAVIESPPRKRLGSPPARRRWTSVDFTQQDRV
jgi:hypothetical protein